MSTAVKEAVRQTAAARRARNPDGCTEPVMSHLTPAELAQLDALARKNMRSRSSAIRQLIVQGLQEQEA